MKRLCLLMYLCVSAPVAAQTVQVRTGEHEDFSRVVLRLPEGTDWSMNRTGRVARIETDRPNIQFDTSGVFELIPKDRLLSATQGGPGAPLELTLNCDCRIEPSTMLGGYLILDIHDDKPAANPLPTVFSLGTRTPYRFGASFEDDRSLTVQKPNAPALPVDPKSPSVSVKPRVAVNENMVSEQRLMDQIERAAAQGLLEQNTRPARKDNAATPDATLQKKTQKIEPTRRTNISATTVIDRDMRELADHIHMASGVEGCISSKEIAITDWATTQPFAVQVAAQRAHLYGEFDKVNSAAMRNLAKIYLHFGFGAEAQELLKQVTPKESGDLLLDVLADILDDRPLTESKSLEGQQSCAGDIAVWVALAHPALAENLDADTMFQGFARLPLHIRRQLGPRLSQSVNEAGNVELAAAILRAMDRAAQHVEPEVVLAEARIESKQGRQEDATTKMLEVVDSGSEYTPEALIDLVEAHLKDQKPLRPDLPDLAIAYSEEYRLAESAPDLRRASAIALSLAGRFEEAAENIKKLRNLDGEEAEVSVKIPFFDLLQRNAGDVEFLSYALAEFKSSKAALPPGLQTRMAERLLELGFAEQAFAMLEQIVASEHPEPRRILRAEAALQINLPHRAMIEVMNLSGPDASDIRSRAMQMNGDFERAAQLQSETGQYEYAARSFWLGDAKAELPDDQDGGRYGHLAELSQLISANTDVEDAAPTLATARRFLDDSELTRQRITELLASVPLEADTD